MRNRIGEWPSDFTATSAFEDLHALAPGGAISYGVGLCPSPVLIVRQRQSENDRGGYAYTLFLDPGDDVWRRFAWNGAALLLSARHDESLWAALLQEPERLATSFLDARLSELAPAKPVTPPAGPPPRLLSVLFDAAVFGGPLVIGPNVGAFPEPEAMAAALNALSPAFRCGRGWMVGGRAGSHDRFGTELVFDRSADDAELPRSTPALDALQRVIEKHQSPALQALLAEPVHQWPVDSAELAGQWMLLAAVASGEWDERLADVAPQGLLAGDLRQALLANGDATGGGWPPRLSRWMLDGYPTPDAIPPLVFSHANVDVLAAYLLGHGLTPASPEISRFKHSQQQACDLWIALVAQAPPDRTIQFVQEANRDLARSHGLAAGDLGRVLDAAFNRPASRRPRARQWETQRGEPAWREIQSRLRQSVRSEEPSDDESALDYLFLRDDEGGEWLLEKHGVEAVARVAAVALAHVHIPQIGAATRAWLTALAQSPVRLRLPLALKERIARAIDEAWRPLVQLIDLLAGEVVLTPFRADANESAALLAELRDVAAAAAAGACMPSTAAIDLRRIAALVNAPLPSETLGRLVEHFTLNDQSVTWLRDHGQAQLAAAVLRTEWRRMPEACAQCTADEFAVILGELLRNGAPGPELVDLLGRANPAAVDAVIAGNQRLRRMLATALFAPSSALPPIDGIVSRLTPETWNYLLDALVAAGDPSLLDVVGVISQSRMPALGLVMYRYLEQDELLREQIATTGWGGVWDTTAPIILAELAPEAVDHAAEKPVAGPRRKKRR